MALLREISPSDPLTQLVLEGLEFSAPILRDIQFYARSGSSDLVKTAREAETPASIFRSLNESNTATGASPNYDTIAKKIVSYDAKVDVILEDRNEDVETELAHQTRLKANEAGWILQEKVFEGDSGSDAEEFDGLRTLVSPSWVLETDTNGIVLLLGNSDAAVEAQQVAIEKLLQLFSQVRGGASHAYMNEDLKVRWLTIAKNLGYYRQSKDEIGNTIEQIGDVIIRGAGRAKNGTALLPFDETVGAASNCSSIFAVRWGERINMTALTSVGVKARFAGQSGNFVINNVNLDMALVAQDATALVQSKGWRLTAA